MKVLVIDVGSTSVKYHLYEMDTEQVLAGGAVERVGSPGTRHNWKVGSERGEASVAASSVRQALELVLSHHRRGEGDHRRGQRLRHLVRVHPSYVLDFHVDTDEANAAGLTNDSVATFDGVQST